MAKNRTSGRGGYRQPADPAPVATPDRNRTDGGPGSKTQPLRRMPDVPYGEQQDLMQQQQIAPLPVANQPMIAPNIFAPTERPGEPGTQGVPIGPGTGPTKIQDNTDTILQALYEVNPSPVILEIINNRQG